MQGFRNWLEPRTLGVIAAVTSFIWLFIELAQDVANGNNREFDAAILMAFRTRGDVADPLGPQWLEDAVLNITAMGGIVVLGLLVVVTVVFLLLARKYRTAFFLLATTVGGELLSVFLKQEFARPRPDLVPHVVNVHSASFPSGHAMMSAVVYLTLGLLVAGMLSGRWLKVYVMAVAVMFAGLIGVSRVYLGVHWPSDVLAGWAVGVAWVLGCWAVARLVNPGAGAGTGAGSGESR